MFVQKLLDLVKEGSTEIYAGSLLLTTCMGERDVGGNGT